jgi:hypothetical protein
MMNVTDPAVLDALEEIRRARPDGKLMPGEVVDAARDPSSPLHNLFQWDDDVAAEAYRLHQARRIIRIHVTDVVRSNRPAKIPVFVSLSTDRVNGGGYHRAIDVLSEPQLRARHIRDIIGQMRGLLARAPFHELDGVRYALDRAESELIEPTAAE